MFIIHGTYQWKPRRVAFRNDFCRTCASEGMSVQVRTFDVLHIFWIPLVPLGFWRRWFCAACGSRPHVASRTRRGFKVAGAIALALMGLLLWAVPMEETGEDAWLFWLLRIGLPLGAIAAARSALRHPPEPGLKKRLAGVNPFQGWTCPLCGGPLLNAPDWHCMTCGAEHRPL